LVSVIPFRVEADIGSASQGNDFDDHLKM